MSTLLFWILFNQFEPEKQLSNGVLALIVSFLAELVSASVIVLAKQQGWWS